MKSPDIVGRAAGVQVSGGLTGLDLRQLPGLFLWYKAEDIALPIGDPIPAIGDAGPFGVTAIQNTSTQQAIVIAVPAKANRKAISLDGVNSAYWLALTPANATNTYTILVAHYHTQVTTGALLWYPTNVLAIALADGGSGTRGYGYLDGGTWISGHTGAPGYEAISWQLNAAGGAVARNLVPVFNTTYTPRASSDTGAMFGNRLSGGVGLNMKGHVFEMAVFSPALTNAQRALVDQYLMNKYEIG